MLGIDKSEEKKLVPLRRFAQDGQYTPAYLSILVQRKKLKAKKIGRNFFTSKEWFDEYLEKHAREAKRAVNESEQNNKSNEVVKNDDFVSARSEQPVEIEKVFEKKNAVVKKENKQVENIFSFNEDRVDFSAKENDFLKNKIFNFVSSVLLVAVLFVSFAPGAAASFVGVMDRLMTPIVNYKKTALSIGSDFYELAVASYQFGQNIIFKTDEGLVKNLRDNFVVGSGESASQVKKEIISTADDFVKLNLFLSEKINLALKKEKSAGQVAGVKEINNSQPAKEEKLTTGIFDNIKWSLQKLGDKQIELSLFFGKKIEGAIKEIAVSMNNEKMMLAGETIGRTNDNMEEYNRGYLAAESDRSLDSLKNIYASVIDFVLPEEIKEKYSPIREIEKIVVEKEFVPYAATSTEYIIEKKEQDIDREEVAKIVNSIVATKDTPKPETIIEKTVVEKVEYVVATTSPVVINNYTNNNYYSSGSSEQSNNFSTLTADDLIVNNSGEIKGNLKVGGSMSANYLNLSSLGVDNLISGRGLSAGKYGLSSDGDVRFNGENNYISGILNLSNILNIDYNSALALAVGDGASDTFVVNTNGDSVAINGVGDITASSTGPALSVRQSGVGNVLSLYDGSVEVFTVLDGGRIGIGTIAPAGKLDVAGNICFNGDCKTSWADAVTTAGYWTAAVGGIHYSSGNVGVGTTTASSLLTVGATSTEQFLVNSVGVVMDGTWNGNIISSAYLPIDIMYQGNNISLLTNDSGYITSSTAETLINKTWNGNPIDVAYGGTGLNSILIDEMIYGSGAGIYATTTITSAGRALLDDIDIVAQRTTLGLGSMSLEDNTGSTTINTLGTITAGVWNGSPIDISGYTNLATSTGISLAGSVLSLTLNEVDHNSLNNLLVGDAHAQYALLNGRAGGQILSGGLNSGDNLALNSNIFNDGYTIINANGGSVGIGTATPSSLLTVGATSTEQFLVNSTGVITDGTWQGDVIGLGYGGTGTSTSFTAGSVLFSNGSSLAQNSSNLYWDDINRILNVDRLNLERIDIDSLPYNVLKEDKGKVHNVNIYSGADYINLPADATVGDEFIFVNIIDDTFTIDAGIGGQIRTSITSDQTWVVPDVSMGETYKLRYIGNLIWVVTETYDYRNTYNSWLNQGLTTADAPTFGNLTLYNSNDATQNTGVSINFSGESGLLDMGSIISRWTGNDNANTYLSFSVRNAGVASERMRLTHEGFLGIGTTTIPAMLTVGATSTEQFLVNSTGVITDGTWQGDVIGMGYGGTGTSTSFAAGSVLFSNGSSLAQNNSGFFWDNTNSRLGLGTTTPATPLQVAGNASANAVLIDNGAYYAIKRSDGITAYPVIGMSSGNATHINGPVNVIISHANGSGYATVVRNSSAAGDTAFKILNYGVAGISNTASAYFQAYRTGSTVTDAARIAGSLSDIDATNYKGQLDFYTNNAGSLTSKMTIDYSGNVGIGTSTPTQGLHIGSVASGKNVMIAKGGLCIDDDDNCATAFADGQIVAKSSNLSGADYAEYFYTVDTDLEPGEIVCVDVANDNAIKRCDRGADDNVMGIVSSDPSIVGNAKDHVYKDNRYKIIGMLGQVPARVSAENGPIRPGDSLTSASSTPGYAMRAEAGDATVGVALEKLHFGTGNIQVLISRRNKSLTVETIEQQITDRIAAMEIQDEVNLLISNAVDNLNIDQQIADVVNGEIVLLDAKLTVETDNLSGQMSYLRNDVDLLLDRLTVLENNFSLLNDKLANFIISDNGEIKISNTTATSSPVAVVEINASSSLSAFVIRQEGGGDLANFYNNDVEIMKISQAGRVTIVGEMMVDGRIMVCSGGACGDNLDMAVDETMGDMGVEGKVVAGAFEGYCDDGWVWVPGSSKYGTMPGFCVMQYEASESLSGLPASNASSSVWIGVNQGEAQLACQSLGSEYHLLSENEWMAIANNIIRVADNDIDQVTEGLQLATFGSRQFLSNYGEINNLAGGVSEWTDQVVTVAGLVQPVKNIWQEYYDVIDYKGFNIAPPYYYSSANGIGRIFTGDNQESLRGFVRGQAGVYDLDLSNAPIFATSTIGFRCAK